MGFTTRSDVGPAAAPKPQEQQTQPSQLPQKEGGGGGGGKDDDDDKADYSESNFDAFEGYSGSLFGSDKAPYEQDDMEADKIWEAIDNHLAERVRKKNEKKEQAAITKIKEQQTTVQQQFSDLKRGLAEVSQEEWDAIPEITDHLARRRKKVKRDFGYVPVPDAVLDKSRQESNFTNVLDEQSGLETPLETPANNNSNNSSKAPLTDLTQLGDARKMVLNLNLKKMSDSVSGQTVVDPKGYLTDLNSIKVNTEAEIGDIKKARLLLKSVTTTNPKHGPGWIAAARLEELAGKLSVARKIMIDATQVCADSEDVWIEAARLHPPDQAKSILAKAVKNIPKSVKIWQYAAQLETEIPSKQRVLRKALEFIPTSVKLWKAAIEMETPEDAKLMLSRAVECVPQSVEMWLALAHLESYQNAKKVLNKAREACPTDRSIWITAAKLEEANKNAVLVPQIIKRALKVLSGNGVSIEREQWLKEAQECEANEMIITAQSIIEQVIGIGVEEQDRKRIWTEDAESCIAQGKMACARAIYAYALQVFPKKKSLWLKVANLEKTHGTPASLDQLLQKAVVECPNSEVLWLMSAKEKWQQGDIDGSRKVLSNAFAQNPMSEEIWLAAVKLENETKETDRARSLLQKARERAGTERVWLKSALLERECGNFDAERKVLEEAVKKYPQFPKLWMMLGQLEERSQNIEPAREAYGRGIKNCPTSIPLYYCAAALEEKLSPPKARALVEKGRIVNPKNPELWLLSIKIERRIGNAKLAEATLAKALQECPNSGILWAEAIEIESRQGRKQKSVDALKQCDNDPYVLVAVAKLFWADRKMDKARTWFNRAISLNADIGDSWAAYYRFELDHGDEQTQQLIVKRCTAADPHHGLFWPKILKAPENLRQPTEIILKKAATLVEPL